MKYALVGLSLFIASLALSTTSTSAHKTKNCWSTAMTQSALDQCASADAHSANVQMNLLYQKLLQRATNPIYRRKLESAQSAWLTYRAAEIEAKYPAENKQYAYGSVYPMCANLDYANITRQRVEELQALLHTQEGEVCSGEWAVPHGDIPG